MMGVATYEDPSATPEERARRFGLHDHVRWYGDDFDSRLADADLASVRVTPPALVGSRPAALLAADHTRRETGVLTRLRRVVPL